MLSLTKLADADYLLNQVALGIDEYYLGGGEAPGVWHGAWAAELGLEGVVDADDLRALLEGRHPVTGQDLLVGRPARRFEAFDATLSAPKSVSLLWALGTPEVSAAVSIAHVEAVTAALDVLEARAGLARRQVSGVRRREGTSGLAVATFVHRTSREGDPQLHSHCVIANLVRRADGSHVALDGGPVYEWKKAVGSIYQEELRWRLSARLGVSWGPDRNGCREMEGFGAPQLRAFSKRSVAIEDHLAAMAIDHAERAAVMAADEAASLATRPPKDPSLTPQRLLQRWAGEAAAVGLGSGAALDQAVCNRRDPRETPDQAEVFARLADPEAGLCARRSRFGEAHVVEAVAAAGAGRLDARGVLALSRAFLDSGQAVRLVAAPDAAPGPARWSTPAHLGLEARVLGRLGDLTSSPVTGVDPALVEAALAAGPSLGDDQAAAVRALCAPGAALRALVAPAGYGKTTTVAVAAAAQAGAGRAVVGLATTNQAVTELAAVGLEAMTLARFRLRDRDLAPGTVVIVDEISQVATADAVVLLDALARVPGLVLWCLGDDRQAQAVRAGGLAGEVGRLGAEGAIAAPALTHNRRQAEPVERDALAAYRSGQVGASQALRAGAGWEHDAGSPSATRKALAGAVVADIDRLGADKVVALAVSHADCEDLADRIRALLQQRGQLGGPALAGPGWGGGECHYAVGDRVLVHASVVTGGRRLHNGSVVVVSGVTAHGLTAHGPAAHGPAGHGLVVAREFVAGRRPDGAPNLSHAWARTVEGAQGGTWDQVHLLGSAALDNHSGYVGQSRGRRATHTWNVTRRPETDHGGVLAAEREPAEEVLGALQRRHPTGYALHQDPGVLDRALSAERAEHLGVLYRCPPERAVALAGAGHDLVEAGRHRQGARRDREADEAALGSFGLLAGLRRSERAARTAAEATLTRSRQRELATGQALRAAEQAVAALEADQQRRAAFLVREGWRAERVKAIDDELARHWAGAVMGAVAQDDPLAFGIDRLRQARASVAADLARLEASMPPDDSQALRVAERKAAAAQAMLRDAGWEARQAEAGVEASKGRRWGRRDHEEMGRAARRRQRAEGSLVTARENLEGAEATVASQAQAQRCRAQALEASAAERSRLAGALRQLDRALDATRPDRVLAMVDGQVPDHLWTALGEAPLDPSGRAAWCGLAAEVERHRDRHPEIVSHGAGVWWAPSGRGPGGGATARNGTAWLRCSGTDRLWSVWPASSTRRHT